MMKMLRDVYETMNEKLEPGAALERSALEGMAARRERRARPAKRPRRVFAVGLACVLALCLSLTAVAAAVPGFRQMLFGGGNDPSAASTPLSEAGKALTEVQNAVAEHDGFRLEILGATHDAESLVVYYTVTDVSGKNRLDETAEIIPHLDLFDQLQLSASKDSPVYSNYLTETMAFDPESGALLCRYTLDTSNAEDMDLSRLKFDIGWMVLGKESISFQPITLEEALFTTETAELSAAPDYPENPVMPATILKPASAPLTLDGQSTRVTAMGFVDGKLHIQCLVDPGELRHLSAQVTPIDKVIAPEEVANAGGYTARFESRETEAYCARTGKTPDVVHTVTEAQYFFRLEDGKAVAATSEELSQQRYTYAETVYDISPEDLQYYNFYYSFQSWKDELHYVGWDKDFNAQADFSVSFATGEARQADIREFPQLAVEGGTIDSLSVNGLTATVTANRDLAESLAVSAKCGEETVPYSKTITYGVPVSDSITAIDDYDGPVTVKYAADRPIDPASITALVINGVEVPLA